MSALIYSTINGNYRAAQFSGAVAPAVTGAVGSVAVGSDVFLFSGPGVLNAVIPHQGFLTMSGVQLNIYDGAAAVSGGPIAASGHVPLGAVPAAFGVSGQLSAAGVPIIYNTPFNSGLIFNSRSGQTGVTIVWTSGNRV